jgi:uncharacterized DUF497 family protein
VKLRFVWDSDKAVSNGKKHRVSFDTATRVFLDPLALIEQDRVVDGEERWQATGLVEDDLMLLVAHTIHEQDDLEVIRILSARRAIRKERRRYEQANG